MIKALLKRLFQLCLVVLISGTLGVILLVGAFLLPTDRIVSHVRESLPILAQETDYFSVTPALQGSQLDNYTEAIYLNEAMVGIANADLLECVLSGYTISADSSGLSPVNNLIAIFTGSDSLTLKAGMFRFFNGYEVILKPLLFFESYSSVRQLNLYISLFLTVLLCGLMLKRGLRPYVPAVIVSILFLRPLTVAMNMTFVGFYYCMIIPCIVMLKIKKETLCHYAWLIFAIAGSASYFFNMNYFQLLSYGMPILFYFLLVGFPENPVELIKKIVDFFVAWLIGYAGMMLYKWTLYAIFVDHSVFESVLNLFLFRASVNQGSRFDAIEINHNTAFGNNIWNLTEFVYIVWNIIIILRKKGLNGRLVFSVSEAILIIVMFLFPIVRYFVLSNHVIIHNWVTYRLYMMPILTVNIIITTIWSKDELVVS